MSTTKTEPLALTPEQCHEIVKRVSERCKEIVMGECVQLRRPQQVLIASRIFSYLYCSWFKPMIMHAENAAKEDLSSPPTK